MSRETTHVSGYKSSTITVDEENKSKKKMKKKKPYDVNSKAHIY